MKRTDYRMKTDIEECKDKILDILKEYNCVLQTEDYCNIWMRDKDTGETIGMRED